MFRYNSIIAVCSLLGLGMHIVILLHNPYILWPKHINCMGTIEDYFHNSSRHTYSLKIKSYHSDEQEYFCSSLLTISCAQKADVEVGDTVVLKNIEIRPPKTDAQAYYFERNNMIGSIRAATFPGEVIERPEYSWQRTLCNTRNKLLSKLESKLSKRTYAFFVSLFFGKALGDYQEHQQLWLLFNNWGIVHYLARSGLHIMLLIWLWRYFFNITPLNYKIKEFVLLILAIAYGLITFNSVSFTRALIMFCIYQTCRLLMIPYHGLYACALTCMLVLIYNPLELFALDFQLTFLITGALLFFFEYRTRHNSCPLKAH